MSVGAILRRVQGVRRSGDGWIAPCPAHEDRSPSLSVHERDGKILLHCHAGCSTEAVCAAAGIEMSELFPGPRIVAQYDYQDEKGALLFQVVRYEPKSFRQRRPDGSGGWIWNLQGVSRVLYRLPEVVITKAVLIVEGEKDAETARTLRLVATCNSGGAGKWRQEYSECLRGKRVAVFADADEPGRKHAEQVARSLHGKVESLKVLELLGAKDLTEWVEKGGTQAALAALISSAPEWKPETAIPETHAAGFTLTPLADLLRMPDTPVDYVLENRLVVGTVSVVVAKPKVGKSTFARNLCLAVARGEDFLGSKTKQGACIYLALEERGEDVKADFRALGADGSEPIFVHAASAPLDGIAALRDLMRERQAVLVVADPLFRLLAQIKDEKAYAEMYCALGPLIDASRASGTHVLFTHHAGKSMKADAIDSPLGSTAIAGAVATVVVLKRTEAYRTIQTVQRIGQGMPEMVLRFDAETRRLSLGESRFEVDRQVCARAILEFLKNAGEPQTQAQIRDEVEGQTRIIRAALTMLSQSNRVLKTGDGTRGKPLRYELPNGGSQYTPGTRKPESQNGAEPRINTGDILVPENSQESIPVPGDLAGQKPFDEGEI